MFIMRKDRIYIFVSITLFAWISMTYFLFVHRPSSTEAGHSRFAEMNSLKSRVSNFEYKLRENLEQNEAFLKHLRESLVKNKSGKQKFEQDVEKLNKAKEEVEVKAVENIVIPVLMFACNRVTVSQALDSLLKIRKDHEKFPIIVSQVSATLLRISGTTLVIPAFVWPNVSRITKLTHSAFHVPKPYYTYCFFNLGLSRPLFVNFRPFHITQFKYKLIKG